MTLEQRLSYLERSNRCLRIGLMLSLLVACVFVTMGARPTASRVLEAEKIVLRDASGTERGELFANEKAWGLVLFTENGQKALALVASSGINGLIVSDQDGENRQMFTSDRNQTTWGIFHPGSKLAQIEVTDNPGGDELVMRDRADMQRVEFGISDKGPGLVLSDKRGTMRAVLSDGEIATFGGD